MNNKFNKTFKITFSLTMIFLATFSGFIGYLYYQEYKFNEFEASKQVIEKQKKEFASEVKKLSESNFNFYEVNEKLIQIKNLNSKIVESEKNLGLNDLLIEREKNIEELDEALASNKKFIRESEWSEYVRDIQNFNSFATTNNWKTLTRVSSRLKVRTPSSFSFEKDISYLLGINLNDVDLMKSVTTKSGLKTGDKSKILEKLEELKIWP